MFDFQPTLAGERLVLRPTTAEDRAPLYALAKDPEVWALHPASDRWKPEVFEAFFEGGLAGGKALTAVERRSGRIIGWSRYSLEFVDPGEVEVGWTFLGRDWWGGAWNGEMKRLMLAHAFEGFERVVLRIGEGNGRSRRAAEKIGAAWDGRATPAVTADGRDSRNLFYVIEKAGFAGATT